MNVPTAIPKMRFSGQSAVLFDPWETTTRDVCRIPNVVARTGLLVYRVKRYTEGHDCVVAERTGRLAHHG